MYCILFQIFIQIQGDLVKKLKAENADEIQIQQAVRELKHRKKMLDEKVYLGVLFG